MNKLLVLVLAVLLLTGCAPALDAQYNEAEVVETAKKFLAHLNAGEYDDCADCFNTLMAAQFDAELLKAAMGDTLARAGAFVGYQKVTTASATEGLITYALVVLTAEYENGTVTYTVSLDPELSVAGFFYK